MELKTFLLKSSCTPLIPVFAGVSLLDRLTGAAGGGTEEGGGSLAGGGLAVSDTSAPVSGFTMRMGFFTRCVTGRVVVGVVPTPLYA